MIICANFELIFLKLTDRACMMLGEGGSEGLVNITLSEQIFQR